MENKTLQMKDICGYLPYGLKVISKQYKNPMLLVGIQGNIAYVDCITDATPAIKPILYPTDYLYKPMIHKGKEIIPIVELANLAEKGEWELHIKCTLNNHDDVFFYADGDFVFYIEGNEHRRTNQLPLFDLCHELKIDIRGLIPQGLAVSVDELEVNPYK